MADSNNKTVATVKVARQFLVVTQRRLKLKEDGQTQIISSSQPLVGELIRDCYI